MQYIQPALAILGALTALVTAISAVTPSVKDDKIATKLQKIGYWADRIGVQFKKSK